MGIFNDFGLGLALQGKVPLYEGAIINARNRGIANRASEAQRLLKEQKKQEQAAKSTYEKLIGSMGINENGKSYTPITVNRIKRAAAMELAYVSKARESSPDNTAWIGSMYEAQRRFDEHKSLILSDEAKLASFVKQYPTAERSNELDKLYEAINKGDEDAFLSLKRSRFGAFDVTKPYQSSIRLLPKANYLDITYGIANKITKANEGKGSMVGVSLPKEQVKKYIESEVQDPSFMDALIQHYKSDVLLSKNPNFDIKDITPNDVDVIIDSVTDDVIKYLPKMQQRYIKPKSQTVSPNANYINPFQTAIEKSAQDYSKIEFSDVDAPIVSTTSSKNGYQIPIKVVKIETIMKSSNRDGIGGEGKILVLTFVNGASNTGDTFDVSYDLSDETSIAKLNVLLANYNNKNSESKQESSFRGKLKIESQKNIIDLTE